MAFQVSQYSTLDQLLHKLAFSAPFVQRTLADLEESLFGKELAPENSKNPIFITSLPRAGTTILLTALADLPQLASHTYRDMPFVMSPLLWSKMSGSFQKEQAMQERAHGDGIKVGFDSPEAFEEVIWRHFWPGKYGDDGIGLWGRDDFDDEAADFFRRHFATIVLLRSRAGLPDGRYISKNNGNIARLDCIPALFPDAKIVMPIRSPMEHATSLLRQHVNFLEQHRTDTFTKRYMHDIGHLEFGELHRPILFPNMGIGDNESTTSLDYWLKYWIAAFEYVLERKESVIVVPHERVCNDTEATLARLFESLGISGDATLKQAASHFRSMERPPGEYAEHTQELRDQAESLYGSLCPTG